MTVEWKESCKIGDADIDAQHEALFLRATSSLNADTLEGQMQWAMSLYEYTKVHFANEEELMRRIQYPHIDKHINQHRGLIAMLHGIATGINEGKSDKEGLGNFMNYWFLTHIATFDTKLAAYEEFKPTHQD
jgi:hemerythrin